MTKRSQKRISSIFVFALSMALTACGGGGGGSSNGGGDSGGIVWEKVPAEFNPREERVEVDLRGVQKVKMNLFGFSGDVRVRYLDSLDAGTMVLQLFTVSKNARTSLSGVDVRDQGAILEIGKYGSYECSIQTKNEEISDVKGACYVRVLVSLPKSAEVEVYNLDRLLTSRFFAMSNEEFLDEIHNAWSDRKMQVVDAYLESYRAIRRNPRLSSHELGLAIHEFSWSDKKFEVLRKLHLFVTDRDRLSEMIDSEFSYFDREQARKIAGL